MRLWNLSSFEKLETPVLSAQSAGTPPRRAVGQGQYLGSPVRIAVQVVALAAISYNISVVGSCKVLTLPKVGSSQMTCNVDPNTPPLEGLFKGRFGDNWTPAMENALLSEAVKKAAAPDRDFFNLVHTAQHESLSEEAPRLTERDILKVTRHKA